MGGSLHVDFQYHVEALVLQGFEAAHAGAVIVAEHIGVFEKTAAVYHVFKFGRADEIIVFAVPLAFARGAGGVRDGDAHVGMGGQQAGNQRGFACAGGGGDDEDVAGGFCGHDAENAENQGFGL